MMKRQKMSLVEALPTEIIVQITSILPLKSIINCMQVCKLWRTLIPNPFLAKHNPNYFMLYNEESAKFAILDHDYGNPSCITQDQIIPMKPSFPGNERPKSVHICGSCNGLICVVEIFGLETRNIHIYNPITGESVTVPKPNRNCFIDGDHYAFGFCPVTNHYKIFRSTCKGNYYINFDVEIYTLGSQRWRHVNGCVSPQIWMRSRPICAGGVLHWIWSEEYGSKCLSIFTFNLATEEFGCAAPPPIGVGEKLLMIGYMDRCLIVTARRKLDSVKYIDIWVRKEWRWTKNWVVRDTGIYGDNHLVPLGISADGIILILRPFGLLYSFDPKAKHGTALVHVVYPRPWPGLVPYDATLISPRGLMKHVRL